MVNKSFLDLDMKKKFIVIPLGMTILTGCSFGNYEGLTAEEWADEYYYCREDIYGKADTITGLQDEVVSLELCVLTADTLNEAQDCL